MQVFAQLRALSEYRRRHLPALQTAVDLDMVREIGYYQVLGAPVTLKQLLLIGLGSSATVQRRLRRFKQLGLVNETTSQSDRRAIELTLSPACIKAYAGFAALLGPRPPAPGLANDRAPHTCALCEGTASRANLVLRVIKDAIRKRQQCVAVLPRSMQATISAGLGAGSGGKRHDARPVIFSQGYRSVDSTLDFFHDVFREARAGSRRVRVVGDMSWAVEKKMAFDDIMEYEARLESLAQRFNVDVVCQYDVRLFSGPRLLRALKTHRGSGRYPLLL